MEKKTNKQFVAPTLPEVNVVDATQTKGKVTAKFTIVDDSTVIDAIEKIDKNQVFAMVNDYFCPVKFDDSILRQSLQPLVDSGIMSEDVFSATIAKAKNEYLSAHKTEIDAADRMSFTEIVAKLKENAELYAKVLNVCNVSELTESRYIENGKVAIFRSNQCVDKDGQNRYNDVTLKRYENGKVFEQNLFVEYREITTTNVILAIRYFASKQDALRKLSNQVKDYLRILTLVYETAKKAKENGFSIEQVTAQISAAYREEN